MPNGYDSLKGSETEKWWKSFKAFLISEISDDLMSCDADDILVQRLRGSSNLGQCRERESKVTRPTEGAEAN